MLVGALNRLLHGLGIRCTRMPRGRGIRPAPELSVLHLRNARILPTRDEILRLMPKGGVVAEVGVAFGDFSRRIVDVLLPRHFFAIDLFELHEAPTYWNRKTRDVFQQASHEEFYRQRFQSEIRDQIVTVKRGHSASVMAELPDDYFDMIYIDAAHEYEQVKADVAVSKRKLKIDGYLVMNDYTMADPFSMEPYGVVQAVHELCLEDGWEILYLALHRYMFCDVALRRLRSDDRGAEGGAQGAPGRVV